MPEGGMSVEKDYICAMDDAEGKNRENNRSYVMSRIRSHDTKPERVVRHWLFMRGYRYRKNVRRLPGTPDIVLRKYAACIFVHGCFWHGHDHISYPKTHAEFWRRKIERNQERDEENKRLLLKMGWNVITVWECQLKRGVLEQTMREVEYWLSKSLLIKAGDKFSVRVYGRSGTDDERKMAAEPSPDGYPHTS